jgi:hypothetical protein
MTARDTHELRLDHWPRLSTFPTGSALVATVILLALGTFFAWAIFKRIPPDGWYLFVGGLGGIATTHYGIKRKTWDPAKGKTESNSGTA